MKKIVINYGSSRTKYNLFFVANYIYRNADTYFLSVKDGLEFSVKYV